MSQEAVNIHNVVDNSQRREDIRNSDANSESARSEITGDSNKSAEGQAIGEALVMTAAKPANESVLAKRVEALEGKIKKYTVIGIISGLVLGGGGILGLAQWLYAAPLDKKIRSYESAMASLQTAISASDSAGAVEQTAALRQELISLDRNYRDALGLIVECMEIISAQGLNKQWLKKTTKKLQQLQNREIMLNREPLTKS